MEIHSSTTTTRSIVPPITDSEADVRAAQTVNNQQQTKPKRYRGVAFINGKGMPPGKNLLSKETLNNPDECPPIFDCNKIQSLQDLEAALKTQLSDPAETRLFFVNFHGFTVEEITRVGSSPFPYLLGDFDSKHAHKIYIGDKAIKTIDLIRLLRKFAPDALFVIGTCYGGYLAKEIANDRELCSQGTNIVYAGTRTSRATITEKNFAATLDYFLTECQATGMPPDPIRIITRDGGGFDNGAPFSVVGKDHKLQAYSAKELAALQPQSLQLHDHLLYQDKVRYQQALEKQATLAAEEGAKEDAQAGKVSEHAVLATGKGENKKEIRIKGTWGDVNACHAIFQKRAVRNETQISNSLIGVLRTQIGFGNIEWIRQILKQRPDLLHADINNGRQILAYLSADNSPMNPAVVTMLVKDKEFGLSVNQCSLSGKLPLYYAFQKNNVEMVKTLMELGTDTKAKSATNQTLLLNALDKFLIYLCSKNEPTNPDMVTILVDRFGLNVNQCPHNSESLLHVACLNNNVKMVKTLIELGADTQAKSATGQTPLLVVLDKYQQEIDKQRKTNSTVNSALIKTLTEITSILVQEEMKSVNGLQPGGAAFFKAVAIGEPALVEIFLKNKTNIDSKDANGCTALWHACNSGNVKLVNLLFLPQYKANYSASRITNEGEMQGMTPLHIACQMGHLEVVKALITQGVDISELNAIGGTPLFYASAKKTNLEVLKFLLQNPNVDVHHKDKNGDTALTIALNVDNTDGAALLLKHATDSSIIGVHDKSDTTPWNIAKKKKETNPALLQILIRTPFKNGLTLLGDACKHGDSDLVNLLIQEKCNVNSSGNDKLPPFLMAYQEGHIDIAITLLNAGADANYFIGNDGTPLRIACNNGDVLLAKFLLEHATVKLSSMDWDGNTILDYAFEQLSFNNISNNALEMVTLLLKHRADFDESSPVVRKILIQAFRAGNDELVAELLDAVPDFLNQQHHHDNTPLIDAYLAGYIDVVEKMLSCGADARLLDKSGYNLMCLAISKGDATFVEYLLAHYPTLASAPNAHGQTPLDFAGMIMAAATTTSARKNAQHIRKILKNHVKAASAGHEENKNTHCGVNCVIS